MTDCYDSEETIQALKKFARLKGSFEIEVITKDNLGFTCYKVFREGKTLACRYGNFYYNVFTEREVRSAVNGFLHGKHMYCLMAPDRIPEFK